MEIATYVAICTNVYNTSVMWARVFTGQPENALRNAKGYVSEDWKNTLEQFKLNPADYDENNVFDVEQRGDKYVAYIYDGNDVEYSWEIVKSEIAKPSPEDQPTLEVFIWNGSVDTVKADVPDINVQVMVHNSDKNYSDEDAYDEAKEDLYPVDWDEDDFVTDYEE
jgi:hypothetical protein